MVNKKSVSNKKSNNKVLSVLVFICAIVLFIYLFNTYQNYQKELNKNSYLSRVIGEIKYNELDKVFTEASDDYFIYITYIDKEKILDLEKDLKKVILKYNIENNIYLLNVTEIYENDDFYKDLNNKLKLDSLRINNVPAIVYYKDKEVAEVITSSSDKLMSATELENLIKLYKINIEG